MNTLQIGDVSLLEKEGGLGRYFADLIRHLPQTGIGHHGLVLGRSAEDDCSSVTSFAAPNEPLLMRMFKLREAALARMHTERFDAIVTHFAPYALPVLDKIHRSALIVHFHGPWATESSAEAASMFASEAKAVIEKLVYRRAKRLIVLSEYFRRELVFRYGVNENIVRVIPGGIDIHRFTTTIPRAEARKQLGWPTNRKIVLSIRRQVRRMGLEELIEAMKLVIRKHPETLLLLGGSGPIAGELNSRIPDLGLSDHVKMLGRVDDALLPMAYRAADLSVVPSRALEGFGLVTLESLASGTPTYVTPVGGLPEVVRPFEPSCVFENSSAQCMAAHLEAAISGALHMPSEQACRDYAVNHFSWPAIARRVGTVYGEALA